MTSIYLIRHAEAEGNLYRRVQGQWDTSVTPLGRRQTAALAERFRTVPLDGLWASDLIRTQSTASAISKYHPELTMHTTTGLREVNIGAWEGRPWGVIAREQPEQLAFFNRDPARWHVPGSESFEALTDRIETALRGIGEAYPGKTVAAVSHAFAIRAFLSRQLGVPFGELSFGDNTAVSLVTVEDGRFHIEWYNDASHLGSLSTRVRQGRTANNERANDCDFVPMVLPGETDLYTRCYSDTWLASHGSLKGFTPVIYVRTAAKHAQTDPQCLMKALFDGRFAGLIEMDPARGREDGAGWISLIWVEPDFRGRRFGTQLVGHAVARFRGQGRRSLRLHVSQTNEAVGFYKELGFRPIGVTQGVGGPLYLMEMDIVPRVWRLP